MPFSWTNVVRFLSEVKFIQANFNDPFRIKTGRFYQCFEKREWMRKGGYFLATEEPLLIRLRDLGGLVDVI